MAYPSTVTTFTNPQPTDKLNSPSHSSIEGAQNTGLTEIQTFLGTLASTAGTIIYDVRATASDGGGHVQGMTKGGTGFTSYTKGDVLVATNTSTLTKLAVGTDNQVLAANSSTASGVNWKTLTSDTNKVANSGSIVGVGGGADAEQSIFSVTVNGSTLGTGNAVTAKVYVSRLFGGSTPPGGSILLNANYGSQTLASILISNPSPALVGEMGYTVIANGSTTAQRGNFKLNLFGLNRVDSVVGSMDFATGTGTLDSSANQSFGITMRQTPSAFGGLTQISGYTVEKIT